MPRFELKFNDRDNWEEHDWLVLKDGRFLAGFATSNAAERFLRDAEQEARIDACVSRAERRRLERLIPQVIEDEDPAADRGDWQFHMDHDQ